MRAVNEILGQAVADGVISQAQSGQLQRYFANEQPSSAATGGVLGDLAQPLALEPVNSVEDSEMPRFVRGFHDVLITIGILIGLAGVFGVGTAYAVVPAIIVLAEILVRRQRLALPAVVLTVLLAGAAFQIILGLMTVTDDTGNSLQRIQDPTLSALAYVAAFPIVLGAFYARYKVPLALAGTLFSAGVTLLSMTFVVMARVLHEPDFANQYPRITVLILFAWAVAIFATALRLDLKDPTRVTRRSDVAFWLHLVAAPCLLYSTMGLVFMDDLGGEWLSGDMGLGRAIAVVVVVVGFMKIGLLLDRRAFVTSGLLSLGYAFWAIFQKSHFTADSLVFYVLMLIGVVVLALGIGWPHIRRFMFAFVPSVIKTKLPPLR